MKAWFLAALLMLTPTAALAGSCGPTIADWQATPTCSATDKDFTLISTTLPSIVALAVNDLGLHIVALGAGASLAPGDYSLNYTIQITDPLFRFFEGAIDTTVPASNSDVTVVKTITDSANQLVATLISLGGFPDGPDLLGNGLTFLNIAETFHVGPTGILSGATNAFSQVAVPAPMTLVLLGLGLLGTLVIGRRRV